MLDIKFICENPELVKENIRRKFKESKLPLVDENGYEWDCVTDPRDL